MGWCARGSGGRRNGVIGLQTVLLGLLGCAPDLSDPGSGVPYDPGGSSGDSNGTGAETSCDAPAPDDVVLGGHVDLPGSVTRMVAHGDGALACGGSFVAGIGADGSLDGPLDLPSACVAVASLDGNAGVVALVDGTVHRFTLEGGLAESATTGDTPTGLTTLDGNVYVSVGDAGVDVFDGTLQSTGTFDVPGALDIAATDDALLVAAGIDGVGLLDPSTGSVLDTLATDSPALGVRAFGDEAIVLRGAQGWDWVRAQGGLESLAVGPTEGVVVDALLVSGHAFIAEGHAISRHVLEADGLRRLSSEPRHDRGAIAGAWIRTLSPVGSGFAAGDDLGVAELQLRDPVGAPDLTVDAPSLQLFGDPGESVEGLYVLRNTGGGDLLLREVDADGPFTATFDTATLEASSCEGQYILPAGASTSISLTFEATEGGMQTGTMVLETNDPDQPTLEVPLEGNPPGPVVGEMAPDFTGLTLDGEPFRLSDHAGKVIFLKLFDFGCSTCSEEFPVIEAEMVPNYSTDDLVIVGVNKGHRTAYADTIAAESSLSFPVVLDIDSQAFRRYRVPNKVFPLHIVIDTDGTIALADTEPGLASVEATLATLLP